MLLLLLFVFVCLFVRLFVCLFDIAWAWCKFHWLCERDSRSISAHQFAFNESESSRITRGTLSLSFPYHMRTVLSPLPSREVPLFSHPLQSQVNVCIGRRVDTQTILTGVPPSGKEIFLCDSSPEYQISVGKFKEVVTVKSSWRPKGKKVCLWAKLSGV